MYFIGIDGGGTKTEAVVLDLEGNIHATRVSDSSNLRNIGIERAVENIVRSIPPLKKEKIESLFVGIPAFAEEFKDKEEEIKDLICKSTDIAKENIFIVSDQIIAFFSGTEKEDGVVVISGTGSVARGWNEGKDIKTTGWGYLTDRGGAFQVGKCAYQKTVEALDRMENHTILTKMVMEKFKAEKIEDLNKIVYRENPVEILSPLSILVNTAAEKGDDIAVNILNDACDYLLKATKNTIEKLNFEKDFPVVLVGGMFKSEIFLNRFKENISPNAQIIIPKESPAMGAARLAIKSYKKDD